MDCARQLMLSHKTCYEMVDKKGLRPLHTLCASMAENRKGMEFAEVCVLMSVGESLKNPRPPACRSAV